MDLLSSSRLSCGVSCLVRTLETATTRRLEGNLATHLFTHLTHRDDCTIVTRYPDVTGTTASRVAMCTSTRAAANGQRLNDSEALGFRLIWPIWPIPHILPHACQFIASLACPHPCMMHRVDTAPPRAATPRLCGVHIFRAIEPHFA